ncbi:MAG: Tim44-like domain-containing protein [Aquabacterium sp.]|nr:Tim44-like domain-containing protein [Aquabacterium sp.]
MKLKNSLMALAMVLAGVGMVATSMDVQAKRLGSGRPAGMQRQMPAKQAPDSVSNQATKPGQQANAAPAQGAAPAAPAGKRSWMGPIAGLAAGLGIAALMSHLGMGEAMGNMIMMMLVAGVAVLVIGWLMKRFKGGAQSAGPQLATAGGPSFNNPMQAPMRREMQQPAAQPGFAQGSASPVASAAAPVANLSNVPAGFDADGFARIAKMIFIRLQAANDAGNVDDLRKFTTPELFASLRLDLQERGQKANQTDVMQLDAELVDTAKDDAQWVVSVRFHGLIREEADQGAQPFDELWHLVKPLNDSGEWSIAGITPLQG